MPHPNVHACSILKECLTVLEKALAMVQEKAEVSVVLWSCAKSVGVSCAFMAAVLEKKVADKTGHIAGCARMPVQPV